MLSRKLLNWIFLVGLLLTPGDRIALWLINWACCSAMPSQHPIRQSTRRGYPLAVVGIARQPVIPINKE